jgi:acetyltransferase
LTRDGAPVVLRVPRLDDLDHVQRLLDGLSARSSYQRFLSASPLSEEYTAVLLDRHRTLDALVATMGDVVVAVGSTHRLDADSAEFAVAVADRVQGHGVGTLVLEGLVDRSIARGLHTLSGQVLSTNGQMLDVLRHLGPDVRVDAQEGVADVWIDLDRVEDLRRAMGARTDIAWHEYLDPLFHPESVVVVHEDGPERWTGAPGPLRVRSSAPVRHLTVPLHRGPDSELPLLLDLAVVGDVSDPARVVREVVGAGARAVVLGSGRPAQEVTTTVLEAARVAAAIGARVIGPGARLVAGTREPGALWVGTAAAHLRPGTVAVVGDRGRATELVTRLARHHVGIAAAVDLGAAVGVGVPDAAAWLAGEPGVGVVLVSSDTTSGRALARALAHQAPHGAPVVARLGQEPPTSSGGSPWYVAAADVHELVSTGRLCATGTGSPAARAVLLTNDPWSEHAGANKRLPALGLSLPDLTQYVERRVKALVPGTRVRGAVVALERDVAAGPLAAVLDSLCEEPGVDAVVVDVAPTPRLRRRELDRVVGLVHESHPAVALLLVDGGLLDAHGHPLRSDVPSFADDARALRALSVAGRAERVEDCEGLLPAPGPRGSRRRR